MQQAMLRCNGVQTSVLTEGRWVEEGLDPNGRRDLVLVIPGNPGIPAFYKDFAKAIKSKLPSETPVWVVGHAGHVQPSSELWYSPDDRIERTKYNLDGQQKHKTEFLKQYVPKDAKIHLVGHSIGAWLILKLLDDPNYTDQIEKCYLLFPTIERMKETPSGKFLTGRVLPIAPVIVFLSWLLTFVPNILMGFLIRVFGGFFAGVTSKSVKPVLQLLDPAVLRRVFRMAKDEMEQVRELDHDAIERHAKKLWLYYGATDGWTPKQYVDELKSRHPNVDAQICERGYRHAFVLGNKDEDLGRFVGEMISATMTGVEVAKLLGLCPAAWLLTVRLELPGRSKSSYQSTRLEYSIFNNLSAYELRGYDYQDIQSGPFELVSSSISVTWIYPSDLELIRDCPDVLAAYMELLYDKNECTLEIIHSQELLFYQNSNRENFYKKILTTLQQFNRQKLFFSFS